MHRLVKHLMKQLMSVAEWLAGWTTKSAIQCLIPCLATTEIATSISELGDDLIGHCCQVPAVNPAENKLFHANQVGAFVGYPR